MPISHVLDCCGATQQISAAPDAHPHLLLSGTRACCTAMLWFSIDQVMVAEQKEVMNAFAVCNSCNACESLHKPQAASLASSFGCHCKASAMDT